MFRINRTDVIVSATFVLTTALCVMQIRAADASPLAALTGGQASCDPCNCNNSASMTTGECDHTSMDPMVQTCSTTDCLINEDYWAECPEMEDGDDCPLLNPDNNAISLVQEYHVGGAPAACTGIAQGVVNQKTPTDCSPWGPLSYRCIIPAANCGGAATRTQIRKEGRPSCQ